MLDVLDLRLFVFNKTFSCFKKEALDYSLKSPFFPLGPLGPLG